MHLISTFISQLQLSFIVSFSNREILRSLPRKEKTFKYIVVLDLFSLGLYCYLLKNAVLSHRQVPDSDLQSAPSNKGSSECVA